MIEPKAISIYTVLINKSPLTGWIAVQRGVNIYHDIETTPLEIRTDSVFGSRDIMVVRFRDSQGEWAGGFNIDFTSITPQYFIAWCDGSYNFPTTLPTATVKVWRITVIESSGINSVQIHCNGEEVLNYMLSYSTCLHYYNYWTTIWSRDRVQIYFYPGSDTASDYYRPYNSPGNYNSINA